MSLSEVKVVGLCGSMGSGKTFFADCLEKKFDFKQIAFAKYLKLLCKEIVVGISDPFSDDAKAVPVDVFPFMVHGNTLVKHLSEVWIFSYVAETLGTTAEELVKFTLETLKQQGPSVNSVMIVYPIGWTFRTVLQIVGTEVFRFKYGSDVWIRMARREIKYLGTHGFYRFVIADVRYTNEADFVHELGGCVIKLSISPDASFKREDGGSSTHASEMELQQIVGDVNIENDYTAVPVEKLFSVVSRIF